MLESGASLPTIHSCDDTGAAVDHGTFAGKRLVIWFYPKADTPG